MTIEDRLIRKIDSRISPEESEAFKKAQAVIGRDRFRPEDFKDVYGPEEIARDAARVRRIEDGINASGQPETEHSRLATIFEALFHEHVELSEWLGKGIVSYRTSNFDDYVNGVDCVLGVEVESRGLTARSYIALGIDVTTGLHSLEKKFDRIFEEIRGKKFVEVKYFATNKEEQSHFRGKLQNLIRLVAGADVDTVKTLSELWVNGKNKELGIHPIQHQILEEMILQCETFKNYAGIVNNMKAHASYKNMLGFLKNIQAEKREHLSDQGIRDSMMRQIKDVLEKCKKRAIEG